VTAPQKAPTLHDRCHQNWSCADLPWNRMQWSILNDLFKMTHHTRGTSILTWVAFFTACDSSLSLVTNIPLSNTPVHNSWVNEEIVIHCRLEQC
jgi:hypothetical protein